MSPKAPAKSDANAASSGGLNSWSFLGSGQSTSSWSAFFGWPECGPQGDSNSEVVVVNDSSVAVDEAVVVGKQAAISTSSRQKTFDKVQIRSCHMTAPVPCTGR